MSGTMAPDNLKALEKMVNAGHLTQTRDLSALADKLGEYGFRGTIQLHLTVTVEDDVRGYGDAVLERSLKMGFAR